MKSLSFLFGVLFSAVVIHAQSNPTWVRDTYLNTYETQKLIAFDINGDQKTDIISVERINFGAFRISYRPNNGEGQFPSTSVLRTYNAPSPNYSFYDIDTIDVDKTGTMDLAVSYTQEQSGVVTHHVDILKLNGSALELYYKITVPNASGHLIKSGYFDGIGIGVTKFADLAVASDNKVYIFINNGPSGSPKFGAAEATPNFTIQQTGMTTIKALNIGEFYNSGYSFDINQGYDEVVIGEEPFYETSALRRIKNNTPQAGSNWFAQFSGDPYLSDENYLNYNYMYKTVNAVDINQDGNNDFCLYPGIRLGSSVASISWPTLQNYNVTYHNVLSGMDEPFKVRAMVPADINNDGKLDIVSSFTQAIDYYMDYPFICYNDGSNVMPDNMVDVSFVHHFEIEDRSNPWAMTLNVVDIKNQGALSIIRITNESVSPYLARQIVVYRRTDNPAPAPPKMKSIVNYQGNPKINWYANPETDISAYELYRGIGTATNLPTYWTFVANINSTSFVDEQITWSGSSSSKKLYYRVKAKDQANQYSNWSNMLYIDYVSEIQKQSTGSESLTFTLHQNYPNPFNPVTSISYVVPASSKVNLAIYNSLGQLVKVLVNGTEESGAKQVLWNGKDENGLDVSSGVYVYKLQIGQQTAVKKMMFVK